MRNKIQEMIDNGYKVRAISRAAKIDYMVLFRFYKGYGRDLMPDEEARLVRTHSLYMEAVK